MNFANHLFISYAHIDNLKLSGTENGWVDLLHERLEIRLSQLLGRNPKIWRDRKLQGNEVFNQTIHIELGQTAILLSVITPRYVISPSCKDELDTFFALAPKSGGLQLADKHRVFKVIKTHVTLEEQPDEMRKLIGYAFYQPDEASGRFREYDYEVSANGQRDKRYWETFEDLAQDISLLIKRFEAPQSLPQSNGATVYLAETTSDLEEQRADVRRELQQHGHIVLPDKPLPYRAPDLQRAVREYLERSRLSVHLIGKYYGTIPEMERERSIVRLQQELAIERGDNEEFSRLIWLPVGLQPEDDRQQKFVVDLQNSFQSRNGSELLQTKFAELQTRIQAKLNKKLAPAVTPYVEDSLTKIYLIRNPQDAAAVKPLRKYLLEQGYEVILPLTEGEPAELLQDHKDNILLCDAMLIYQGQASEKWLDQKVKDLLKLRTLGRTAPLLAKAIYLGPPESESKEDFMTNAAKVITNHGDFNPDSLAPFIAQINQAKGAQK